MDGKNNVFGISSCLWKIYLLGGLFTETGVTKLPSRPLAISPSGSPSPSSFPLLPLYLTWQSWIKSSCIKISGPCVVRDSHRTFVIPKANPRILRRDEGKPPQPDYIQKGAWKCASKNRPEVEKRAQMWKDKQKVLEEQVEQKVVELTKVRSW